MLPAGCVTACRGCGHREFSEAESLRQKHDWLTRVLGAFAEVPSVSGGGVRLGYRKKSTLSVDPSMRPFRIGMRVKTRESDEVLAIPECPVHDPVLNRVFARIAETFPDEIPLLYVLMSGDLLSLVLKTKESESLVRRVASWWEESGLPEVRGVHLNFHPSAGNRVLSASGWRHLAGESAGSISLFGRTYAHGPSGFLQVNPALYESALLEAHRHLLATDPRTAILDLYSGIGVSLDLWGRAGRRTIGVELSGEAVRMARVNAGREVLQGKCEERIPQLEQFVDEGAFSAFCNPPRTGLAPELLGWFARKRARVERIAYLSCSAGTLARDLETLRSAGYRIERIQPYDFFPGTPHVETLALLT